MRVLLTADLHFNHGRSCALAEDVIGRINAERFDVLVVVGDTAPGGSSELAECLGRFTFSGPKIFVAGNHELWTKDETRDASYRLFTEVLPRRVRELGWIWGEGAWVSEDRQLALVGSVGWYDYSYAIESLAVPRRFYEAKVSPGAAAYNSMTELFEGHEELPAEVMGFCARWNDGRFVKLGRSDEEFLGVVLSGLEGALESVRGVPRVIVGVHHVPFAELLPPVREGRQWAFARAYLGSGRIGEVIRKFGNVTEVYCGHSHFAAEAVLGGIKAVNIGAGYRGKRYVISDGESLVIGP